MSRFSRGRVAALSALALTVTVAMAAGILLRGATIRVAAPAAASSSAFGYAEMARASAVGADPVIAAAGDITSDGGSSGAFATSDLLVANPPTRVLPLGDLVYPDGQQSGFTNGYDRSWGRVKDITSPAPGNHDQHLSLSQQYYWTYFGSQAGEQGEGWYSFDLGRWHVIALNSGCASSSSRPNSPSCDASSEQVQWLAADLAAHPNRCVLAYWHHPRFSSGSTHGNNATVQPFWDVLFGAEADVVLAGHEHVYERFAPQTPSGSSDPSRGIRQFTVGTGGIGRYSFGPPKPNSELRYNGGFGVLRLTLRDGSYEWEFVSEAGKTFTDSGSGTCGLDTTPPDTAIDSAPPAATNSTSASFSFSSNETGATFECKLDGALFSACSSPKTYTGLSDGSHTFQVRATDPAGNTDPTPATRTWTIDTIAPDTTITSGPSGVTYSSEATFVFSSNETEASFECRFDSETFSACTSPKSYSGLSAGDHTFSVRAVDRAGNVDASGATRSFRVDPSYPHPSGAARVRVTLLPAFEECTAPNTDHGAPLDSGSCDPAVQSSSHATVPNDDSTLAAGSALIRLIPGDLMTPTDEADVDLIVTLADIRQRTDLTDYVGELDAEIPLRITDRLNGPSEAESGTVEDFTLEFPVPCTPTLGDLTRGSTCQTATTADTLSAGMVTEARRTSWELGQVELFDGGFDGLASTEDNTLFAVQGVFVP